MSTQADYVRTIKNVDGNAVLDKLISVRFYFIAKYANPQGDTETNTPRVDPVTGIGLITPVGLKRHVRDYLETRFGANIFIRRNSNLAEQTRNGTTVPLLDVADEEAEEEETEGVEAPEVKKEKGKKAKKPAKTIMVDDLKEQVISDVCRAYDDVRAFGQVLTKPINRGITGPVQFTFGQSVYPVDIIPFTLTRCAVASDKEKETKDRTMGDGAASVVRFGIYYSDITFNPNAAKRTGFTWEDVNRVLDALQYMWTMKKATNRAGVNFREMFVFVHKGPYATVQEARLFESIKVAPTVDVPEGETFSPNSESDFTISCPENVYKDRTDMFHVN